MWSELNPIWKACLEESWQAFLNGCLPIGSVIADKDGQIIARGQNQIYTQVAPPRQVCDSILAHAELNALLSLPRDDPHLREYTLYTTMEPCPLCLGAIYMSGIRSFSYAGRDPYAGSTNLLGSTPYLSKKQITILPMPDPLLEIILLAMQIEDRLRLIAANPDRTHILLDAWAAAIPESSFLGKLLYEEDTLRQMKKACWPVGEAFDALASLYQTRIA